MKKKAQAYIFFIFLLSLILIGMAISILMKPMGTVYDTVHNRTELMEDDYQQFFTRTKTIWIWLPAILGVPLMVWMLSKAQER